MPEFFEVVPEPEVTENIEQKDLSTTYLESRIDSLLTVQDIYKHIQNNITEKYNTTAVNVADLITCAETHIPNVTKRIYPTIEIAVADSIEEDWVRDAVHECLDYWKYDASVLEYISAFHDGNNIDEDKRAIENQQLIRACPKVIQDEDSPDNYKICYAINKWYEGNQVTNSKGVLLDNPITKNIPRISILKSKRNDTENSDKVESTSTTEKVVSDSGSDIQLTSEVSLDLANELKAVDANNSKGKVTVQSASEPLRNDSTTRNTKKENTPIVEADKTKNDLSITIPKSLTACVIEGVLLLLVAIFSLEMASFMLVGFGMTIIGYMIKRDAKDDTQNARALRYILIGYALTFVSIVIFFM